MKRYRNTKRNKYEISDDSDSTGKKLNRIE